MSSEEKITILNTGEVSNEVVLRYLSQQDPEQFGDLSQSRNAPSSASNSSLAGPLRAKREWNQCFVDMLCVHAEQSRRKKKDKLTMVYMKAAKSISVLEAELHCKADFLRVSGVGNHVARDLMDCLSKKIGAVESKQGAGHLLRKACSLASSLQASNEVSVQMGSSSSVPSSTTGPTLTRSVSLESSAMATRSSEAVHDLTSLTENMEGCKVVLLLDSREVGFNKQRHFFENRLREHGILVERRGLPLGDILWVIRTPSKQEYVCDVIVERKTVEDLAQSIKDGRYWEQKSRISKSSVSMRIYLVEGDIKRVSGIAPKAVETAIIETRLCGFFVQQTTSQDATCEYLLRLHKNIENKFKQGGYSLGDPNLRYETFNTNSRGATPETVKQHFQAMLLQVPNCSPDKARAITDIYPTPDSLYRAYFPPGQGAPDQIDDWHRKVQLLENIQAGVGKRRIGPKLSATLASLYCQSEY